MMSLSTFVKMVNQIASLSESEADAALREYEQTSGRNESIAALFRAGEMLRKEKAADLSD